MHPFEKAGLGKAPFRCVGYAVRKFQACPGAPVQCGTSCDYCGTGIMHAYQIQSADGRSFVVGCDCVGRTGDAVLKTELKAARTEARRDAVRIARKERAAKSVETFLATTPGLAEALKCEHPIVQNIGAKLAQYLSLSAAQVALVFKLAEEAKLRAELVGCADPEPVNVPRTVGRVELVGKVLCVKFQESFYGGTLKMLLAVRTPDGFWKAWSTVPAALARPVEKGQIVNITAGVEVSDDPMFAFLVRPTVTKPKAAKAPRTRKAA